MTWTRERISVSAYFAVLGFLCATWVSSIDDMKLLLGLDEAQQGWLLFSGSLGSLVSFAFAGALVMRLGSRRSLILAASAYLVSILSLATCFFFRASVLYWRISLAALGMSGTIFNISLNTQGGIVERDAGRTIMNSFHAMFSATCLAGGLAALAAVSLGIAPQLRLLCAVLVCVAAHVFFSRYLPAKGDAVEHVEIRCRAHPDRMLVMLGLAAVVIFGCECSANDWVCVFFRDVLGAAGGRAKWGFCAFCGAMAVGRAVTDRCVNRFGAVRVLRAHCVLAALGFGIALASPDSGCKGILLHVMAAAGYALAGYGMSALAPILYSRANRAKTMPAASAVTFVASMGFLGSLVCAPAIGHIAKATSLRLALGACTAMILSCLLLPLEDDCRP